MSYSASHAYTLSPRSSRSFTPTGTRFSETYPAYRNSPTPRFLESPSHARIRKLFIQADTDRQGRLGPSEVYRAVRELWPQFDHDDALAAAFRAVDKVRLLTIDELQFGALLQYLVVYENLWKRYSALDIHNDGKVSLEEVVAFDPRRSRGETVQFFDRPGHKDSNGRVNYDAFCRHEAEMAIKMLRSSTEPRRSSPKPGIRICAQNLVCYVCGKAQVSLLTHQKICLQRFRDKLALLPVDERPEFSEPQRPIPPFGASDQQVEQFNREARSLNIDITKRNFKLQRRNTEPLISRPVSTPNPRRGISVADISWPKHEETDVSAIRTALVADFNNRPLTKFRYALSSGGNKKVTAQSLEQLFASYGLSGKKVVSPNVCEALAKQGSAKKLLQHFKSPSLAAARLKMAVEFYQMMSDEANGVLNYTEMRHLVAEPKLLASFERYQNIISWRKFLEVCEDLSPLFLRDSEFRNFFRPCNAVIGITSTQDFAIRVQVQFRDGKEKIIRIEVPGGTIVRTTEKSLIKRLNRLEIYDIKSLKCLS